MLSAGAISGGYPNTLGKEAAEIILRTPPLTGWAVVAVEVVVVEAVDVATGDVEVVVVVDVLVVVLLVVVV